MASRALVLGGGGPVGIAWECGLLAGFARNGLDLGEADLILGTSAGSFVGLRIALGAETAGLADPIFADAASPVRPVARGGRPPADLSKLMRMMARAQEAGVDPQAARAEIGAYALSSPTMGEDEYMASFGRWFASQPDGLWPERGFACGAVDAASGAFELWTRDSGVGVTRAVAASCSMPSVHPPVTIGDRRYYDGGGRSATNADLATGHDRVVVVALQLAGWTPAGALTRIFTPLEAELQSLRDGGAEVLAITPDAAGQAALAGNLMDFRKRPEAARAGFDQAAAMAEDVQAFWSA